MPELPEVETIKRQLEETVLNKEIKEVIINNPKVIKELKKDDFIKGLKNTRIKKILRRGKCLILELSSGRSLVVHLKLTGQLVYPGRAEEARVSFKFSDGKLLDFCDQRLLGELRLVDDWQALKFIQELGPEPFDLKLETFKGMLAHKKAKIKTLLMDQKFISGVGNLYAAEALFRAGIHPERSASGLSEREKEVLFREINQTLKEAIEHKGSSVDQYRQLSGEPGEYEKYHKVYGREGEPCPICKTPIQKIELGGRGTYFCPKCQR